MGVMLINPENDEILVAIKLDFPTTNNEAEYEAILAGLGIAKELGAKSLDIRNDSQVVVGHVDGTFEAKGENMIKYLPKVLEFHEYLDRVATTQIPRA
jgi:ribonuclease HI